MTDGLDELKFEGIIILLITHKSSTMYIYIYIYIYSPFTFAGIASISLPKLLLHAMAYTMELSFPRNSNHSDDGTS